MRRVAVTIVAVALVLSAEIAATLSATAVRAPGPRHAATVGATAVRAPGPRHAATEPRHAARIRAHASPPPYSGEPYVPVGSIGPAAARMAAVRFVRDCALWSSRSLAAIPAEDATRRVIQLIEQAGRIGTSAAADAVASVRLASAGEHGYVVTSAIGNFLLGRRERRWLVVSVPGD